MSAVASRKPVSSYRPPPHRSLPPMPPRWAADMRAFDKPPLAHFVLLSILLHMLAILLFGAPSGGSREGRAMWGSLDVVIKGPIFEPTPMLKLDRGQFLPMLPEPPPVAPAPRKVEPPPPSVIPEPTPAATVRDPIPAPEPLSIPPLLERLKLPDRQLEMAPTFRVPPPRERPAPPPPPVEAPLPAPPAPAPAPRVERIPTEAPPLAAPLAPAVPPPPPPAPAVDRAPVEAPAVPSITPTPPVERPPVEVPVLPVPESVAPARVEPAPKPVEKTPTPEVAPTPAPVPTKPPSALERAIERAQEIERGPPAKIESPPLPTPLPRESVPGPSAPADKKGLRDFPAGRSDYDPTKGGLDLDAMRNRAGQMAREGSGRRALLPFPLPPVEKPKSKLETAIEKARKPDCKDAYKDMGLLAVVPLVANEFGEGNCRW